MKQKKMKNKKNENRPQCYTMAADAASASLERLIFCSAERRGEGGTSRIRVWLYRVEP